MKKMTEKDGQSLDMVTENLEALKSIFSEAYTEEGIDFEVLRQLLGNMVADNEEKYGLSWYGKKKARQIALTPSLGTLQPRKDESVDWDTTQNLFFEGDNLEVLKLLQKSYANKVKMIYIDPPYNTGKEFIYPDKFQDNLDTYLRYTGQKDDEGFRISSNTESSGRFHTNWLNMMLPRLKLARALLKDDGIIFISSDDHEQARLKIICDEIFGEANAIEPIIWKKRYQGAKEKHLVAVHEYILIYAKQKAMISDIFVPCTQEHIDRYYTNQDENFTARGGYRTQPLEAGKSMDVRKNLQFSFQGLDGKTISPKRQWVWSKERIEDAMSHGEIGFTQNGEGQLIPFIKQYLKDRNGVIRKTKKQTIIDNVYTQNGTKEIELIFGKASVYPFPKPTGLIKQLMEICDLKEGEIVLDFFAGSCTTADATFQMNINEGINRRCISVQLPEPCEEKSEAYKAGYKTIAEIGKERIRLAATKIKEENSKYIGDLGFKVFKLDSSNIRAWDPDRNNLEQTLLDHMEHLVEGRSEEDVLYELLLKRGVDLAVPIEEKTIRNKTVYSIGYGVLFACLEKRIKRDQIEGLAMGIIDWHKELEPATDTQVQVVFRDSAFENDISKTNMTAILEQHGIAHVRSL